MLSGTALQGLGQAVQRPGTPILLISRTEDVPMMHLADVGVRAEPDGIRKRRSYGRTLNTTITEIKGWKRPSLITLTH